MTASKRLVLGLAAILGMLIASFALFGTSAGAAPHAAPAPYPTSTAPGSSSSGGAGSCSSSSGGSSTSFSCSGFDANTALCEGTSPGSGNLGKGTTDSDGNFSDSVSNSSVSDGQTVYVGPCGDTAAADSASVTINLSSSGGNLSSTGVAVIGISAIGLVLLVGGGLMVFAGRRRGGSHA